MTTIAAPSSRTRTPRPRVVMFDPGYFLPYYVDHLCESLRELGLESVVVASPPFFETIGTPRYRVEHLFFPFLRGSVRQLVRHHRRMRQVLKGLTYPFGIARTLRALGRGPTGVFHLQWAPIPTLDWVLVRLLKARGWRVVYTVHDPLPEPARTVDWRQYRALLKLTDAVIVHTPQQARELDDALPEITRQVHVIPHGGIALPPPSDEEKRSRRTSLGLDADRPLLLFFGMIKPYKGLEYLIAAMPEVITRFPRALLMIAGEPFISLEPVEQQIAALGLKDHVVLRPGFVPTDDVPRYLRAADLLIAPYVKVGVSGVVVLAQGHAVPVVVTRVGGLPAFVEDGVCGFVVPPRVSTALADAISRGLSDGSALAEMGRRGWTRLRRENRWTDVARATSDVYLSLLESRAPSTMPLVGHAERLL